MLSAENMTLYIDLNNDWASKIVSNIMLLTILHIIATIYVPAIFLHQHWESNVPKHAHNRTSSSYSKILLTIIHFVSIR
jgi:hypothetical protein